MNSDFGHWTFEYWIAASARCWLSILFVFFTVFFAGAQTEARAEPDSNYAETGNPFTIHLHVLQSAGKPGQIDLSAWNSVVPEQNIVKQTDWTPDGKSFTKDLTILFFDADTLTLPPLPIHLKGNDTAMTNPLEIVVLPTPSPDDLVDMRGIKDIYREPTLWTDYLPWILAIGGFVLFILLAAWLIDRANKRKRQAALSRTLALPPHELASKKLDVLAQKDLWHKGLVKEYCAELTFIVREYLEKRYFVLALESTSEEILIHLQKTDFPEELRAGLYDLLAKADLVKFAKATPPEAFHDEAMSFARKIIAETKPLPIPVDENTENLESTAVNHKP